jgi:nitrate/nitrite transporter NarK
MATVASTGRCSSPQVVMAIAASLLGGGLARRMGSKRVFLVEMAADALAMVLQAVTRPLTEVADDAAPA